MTALTARLNHSYNPTLAKRLAMIAGTLVAAVVFLGTAYGFLKASREAVRIGALGDVPAATEALANTPDIGRVLLNSRGKVLKWNRGMSELTGFRAADMIGQTMDALEPPTGGDPKETFRSVFHLAGQPWFSVGPLEITQRDGTPRRVAAIVVDTNVPDSENFRLVYLADISMMKPFEGATTAAAGP